LATHPAAPIALRPRHKTPIPPSAIIDPVNALQCDSASNAPQPRAHLLSGQRNAGPAKPVIPLKILAARALGTGGIFPPIALVIGG